VCGRRSGEGRIWGTGILVPELIGTLIPSAGRPIVDATGLTGRFDLEVKWTPDPVSADGVSLFTAIQDQLGLRLEPGSAPMEVLVIDSAQRPAEVAPPVAADRPTFEVASIRLNKSGAPGGGVDAAPNGRVVVTNTSLQTMVRNGFELQGYELVSGPNLPSWVNSDRWDIVAQGPAVKDQASLRQLRLMLQNLLIDRFRLMTRRETREMPVYALTVARNDRRLGTQLRSSSADCAALVAAAAAAAAPGTVRPCGRQSGPGFIRAVGVPMADFARTLSIFAGRAVVDETALTDRFDLDLTWTPEQGAGSAALQGDGGSLFTAIQEQLGLHLEPRRAPVSVFVLESAERPAEE
jgi:uncharacterized protein (TIGR03435 family)